MFSLQLHIIIINDLFYDYYAGISNVDVEL